MGIFSVSRYALRNQTGNFPLGNEDERGLSAMPLLPGECPFTQESAIFSGIPVGWGRRQKPTLWAACLIHCAVKHDD